MGSPYETRPDDCKAIHYAQPELRRQILERVHQPQEVAQQGQMGKRGLAFVGSRPSASRDISFSFTFSFPFPFFFPPHHSLLVSTSPSFNSLSCCLCLLLFCLSFFYYCCCYCITTANVTVLRVPIIALSPYRSQRSFVLLNPLPIRHSTPVHSLKTASFAQSTTQFV